MLTADQKRDERYIGDGVYANPDTLNWSHVGSANHLEELLRQAAAFIRA